MQDDMSKYKDAYLSEARNYIKGMNLTLIQWEKHPSSKKHLPTIFRMAHTLKSMSASMGYHQIAGLTHAIEDLLDAIRNKKLTLKASVNLLFNALDYLEKTLQELAMNHPEMDAQALTENIKALLNNEEKTSTNETLKNLDSPIEELTTIEVKVDRLDKLLNLTKELLVNKMRLETLSELIQSPELTATVDIMNRTVSELQYHVMQIRLVPIGFIFDRFIRLVRDISTQQQKEIDLRILGREIEIDRSIIDPVSEILAHIIKNAIDHGLETPEERKIAKKNPMGTLILTAKRESESIVIEISDDGKGINLEAIKQAAIKNNLLSSSASKEEIITKAFTGISTSEKVTTISGRGLGLPIVKQKVEAINGKIEVFTDSGKGTTFVLKIPIRLTVIFVLLVRQAHYTYAIPLNNIDRLLSVHKKEIKGTLNHEIITYEKTVIPLIYLSQLFNVKHVSDKKRQSIVVLKKDNYLLGLVVETLLTTEEIITQPINILVTRKNIFSGTALLGSGETILILDIEQLFALTAKHRNKLKRMES